MVQYRGRKTPRFTAAMGEYFERMTSSYCPECGRKSAIVDGVQVMRRPEEGSTVKFACPECGEFSVEHRGGKWFVSGTDVPYIMCAEGNSATRLHRFDPSCYETEAGRYAEHVRLMCETVVDYHYVGDTESSVSLIKEAFALSVEALKKGVKDRDNVFFGCFNLLFTMASNGRLSKEDVESAVSDIMTVTDAYDRIFVVGLLSMCAESLGAVGGKPNDEFLRIYSGLSQSEPESMADLGPFSDSTFWEGLALVAVTLKRDDDVGLFVRKTADTWLKALESNRPTEDDLDRMMMFILTLSDSIETDLFENVLGPILEMADRCGQVSPYLYDSVLMVRYEHRLENGLDPYDRTSDLSMLIEKYSDPKNVFEASIAVKSYVHRALEAEDLGDVFADMSSALDIIISTKLHETEYCDLVMDMAVRYYDLADEDKKVQRSAVLKLKKIGITKEMLKAWKKHSKIS